MAKILDILIQVLSGLEILHEHNNVHRDIKPQNILIDETGAVKLGDFGLCSKVLENVNETTTNFLAPNQPNLRLMTFNYGAPEQLLQKPHKRSDV